MIEGKIANRTEIKIKMGSLACAFCERCNKLIDKPKDTTFTDNGVCLYLKSYMGTDHFVYEARGGYAVCYCSKWCAKKHNHRFRGK